MIRRTRLRKMFAGTQGLRTASLTFLVGFACFIVGSALSFKLVILPALEAVEEFVEAGELDPEAIVTPGIFVQRVVKAGSVHVRWSD